jgi:hypothetical protein
MTEHTSRPNGRPHIKVFTEDDFVRLITASWNKQVASIVQTGRWLILAKKTYGHGRLLIMIEDRLPFGPRVAQQLMEIAKHPVIGNASHDSHLPRHYVTLYKLTRLPEKQLKKMLADGTVNAETERQQVEQIAKDIKEHGVYWWSKVKGSLEVLLLFMTMRDTPADINRFVRTMWYPGGRNITGRLGSLAQFITKLDEACRAKRNSPAGRAEMKSIERYRDKMRRRKQRDRRDRLPWAERNRRRLQMERINGQTN